MTTSIDPTPDRPDLARLAKEALERVCSGAGLHSAGRYYSPAFVDHVNDLEFRGLEGAAASVGLYRKMFREMSISVVEQVIEKDRVTSRFVVQGTNHGRRVRFNGITISRFENGHIVEDWSVTDTLGMLRQLGPWRSVLLGLRTWQSVRAAQEGHLDACSTQNAFARART